MFRDEERTTLDEIIRKMGTAQADAVDKKIIDHLARELFRDPRFVRWFKSHYDFSIALNQPQYEFGCDPTYHAVETRTYRFRGPDWVPFREKLRRKIRDVLRRLI